MTNKSDSPKKPSSKQPRRGKGGNTPPGDKYELSGDFRGAVVNIKSTIVNQAENNVRLQNLRDFTVQIWDADNQIVGTGIAVSTNGRIVTCAHVVHAAGVEPRIADGAEVGRQNILKSLRRFRTFARMIWSRKLLVI